MALLPSHEQLNINQRMHINGAAVPCFIVQCSCPSVSYISGVLLAGRVLY